MLRAVVLTESEFFEGLVGCLWEHEEDKNNFEPEPAAVADQIPPRNAINTYKQLAKYSFS